jgi:hypothetical protein
MQNARMNKALKWVLGTGLVAGVGVSGAVWGLQIWLNSADFKARLESETVQSLGVGVTVGKVDVSVWPKPGVVMSAIEVQTTPVLSLAYVGVRPELGRLISGEWSVGSVLVRDAMLPQHGIDAFLLLLSKTKQAAPDTSRPVVKNSAKSPPTWFPRELLLKNVAWVNAKGLAMTFDLQAEMNAQGETDKVSAQMLQGFLNGSTAQLTRQGSVWTVALNVGGGTVTGPMEFQVPPKSGGTYVLTGQLETQGVEVAALSTAATPVLSGQLEASTTLSARTTQIDALSDVLESQSQFTVKNAVLHGIDLAKAVTTVGISQGGNTSLDVLAGQVRTQGRVIHLNNLEANSGVLSATGQMKVAASRTLSGEISVNLAATSLGGAVGVPLEVGGTLDAPQVNLSRSALIGAAIGTVLMPGVGTAAGASVADRLGEGIKKLFGR